MSVGPTDVGRPPMHRWTAELVDRQSERRFRRYNLPQQRRAALGALVLILAANLGSFILSVTAGDAGPSLALWLTQAITNAIGAALVVTLIRVRRPRHIFRVVVAAVLFLTLAVGLLLATGEAMAFRGALLVVGGVVVVYLSAPLTLVGVTTFGLLYSAVTIPVWLLATDRTAAIDVPYVLLATALAHGLSFIEARRAQRERRVLFAQRELLHHQSTADPLTGLINRRAFDARLALAWTRSRSAGEPLSVLMVDIDHFKLLNDTHGHAAGDRALRVVASVVQLALPSPSCDAARYGGEEFACLLPGVDAQGALRAAEDLVGRIRVAAIPAPGPGAHLTVSVGVATATEGMESAIDLLGSADRQLYCAKESGRDRVAAVPAPPSAVDPAAERSGGLVLTVPPDVSGLARPTAYPASAGITWSSSRSSDLAS